MEDEDRTKENKKCLGIVEEGEVVGEPSNRPTDQNFLNFISFPGKFKKSSFWCTPIHTRRADTPLWKFLIMLF